MRLQKEEQIAVVLLLMALGTLAVAFWAFADESPGPETSRAAATPLTVVQGQVLEIKETRSGGHQIIRLDSTPLQIFVPRDGGAEEVGRRVHAGDQVTVSGTAEEFSGQQEIKVRRSQDVVLMGQG